ncbi:MAG: hypothetical protein JJLCMIEE_00292 [Acidimicrobiales bacterium]|nr:MAG: hypothetical protein EDR02_01725 [Actinomycetota bacterium]MBV6507251.1 hypothetical protein [Acidimicrobiales bacterium]RIK04139.1 MAG: hypothetical protein DCC48_14580 [Acidobacteriota bacterium]
MSRRIEIELTSSRDDGIWTWRAAGAREPKGELEGGLLYDGAKVGDVVRADAEFNIDGIEVRAVLPPRSARKQPELLEIVGSGRSDEPVTTSLVRRDRREGGRKPRDGAGRRDGDPRRRGEDRAKARRPQPESRPKPKRLRAGRANRKAVLDSLPAEQAPVAEQVLRGGIPAVRQAVERQNELARSEGRPEVKPDQLMTLAEDLLPRLREAEWRDRAEAAKADIEELDLRDLRSVVVAADTAARDEECRRLAVELREALQRRVEEEHAKWLAELSETLADGRLVRALRLSSRPPKAGAPLPADLGKRLAAAASDGLTSETTQDRWATVLDAVAYSPVRSQVVPVSWPVEPNEELLREIARLASRLPHIAGKFGIEPSSSPGQARGARPRVPRPSQPGTSRSGDPKQAPAKDRPAPRPPEPGGGGSSPVTDQVEDLPRSGEDANPVNRQ